MADELHKPLDADAEQKRIAQAEEDRKAREQAETDRRKQARDAPLVPNAEGIVMIEAIMGPYRGQRLQMKEADGTAAINNHWARNPTEAEYQYEELKEDERKAAWDASHKWANDTWEAAQKEPDDETKPPGEEKRSMSAGEAGGGYTTRAAEPAKGSKR